MSKKQHLTLTCPPIGLYIQWQHVTRRRGSPIPAGAQAVCQWHVTNAYPQKLDITLCFLGASPDYIRKRGVIVHESVHAAYRIVEWLNLHGWLETSHKEEAIAELTQCLANIGFKWTWNQCDPDKDSDVYAWVLDTGLKHPGMIRESVWG